MVRRHVFRTVIALMVAVASLQLTGATHVQAQNSQDQAAAALTIGLIGLTAGALIASTATHPRYYNHPRYYRHPAPPPPRVYYRQFHHQPPHPSLRGAELQPWTPQWYASCARRYRSFNPDTGYFLANSGQYRFCR